ncbi:MAG: serine protease [Candidatus Synoicihabitans palmerolidicus]|nr:serine protease [Candidatus Synoicihabitans palmerolidicus]
MRPTPWLLLRLLGTTFILSVSSLSSAQAAIEDIRSPVVKIHTTHRYPDVQRPWTRREPSKATGSGTILTGGRILTNAHVVRNASQIYVQPFQSSEQLPARVIAISHQMDLAVLELKKPAAFVDYVGLPINTAIPQVQDTVNVYGFPTGGEELSVTEGIVSRSEFTGYYYGGRGLRVQVDAALNPGNSGGPAIANDELIELVYSGISKSQSIGYLIPSEEINLFLSYIEDGVYDGKPSTEQIVQSVENDTLRTHLKLSPETGGIMIINPARDDPSYPLRRWDVITQIGDYKLDRQGNVLIDASVRLNVGYLLQHLTVDDKLPCTFLRDGEEHTVQVPLYRDKERVIPYLFEESPRYFIYGPLIFSIATQDHLARLSERGRASLGLHDHPLVTRSSD